MSESGRADNACRRTTLARRLATPRGLRRRLHLIGRVVWGGSTAVCGVTWRMSGTTAAAVESLKDLVERILGEGDQPPRENAELILLIAGIRQHLPHLARVVKGQDPALTKAVRSLREAPVSEGRMPLVIHAIRLAEMAQALIDRVDAPVPSPRAAGPVSPTAGQRTRVLQDSPTAPVDDDLIGAATALTSIAGGARIRVPQRRSEVLEASALPGFLQGCGPPAA